MRGLGAGGIPGPAAARALASRVGGDPGFPPFAGGLVPALPRRPSRLAVLETAGWAEAAAAAGVGVTVAPAFLLLHDGGDWFLVKDGDLATRWPVPAPT